MTYTAFKRQVFNYLKSYSPVKKSILRKNISFKQISHNKLWNCYEAVFTFRNKQLTLSYNSWYSSKYTWTLYKHTSYSWNDLYVCHMGTTIYDCCDYLWNIDSYLSGRA